jgi:hypothetical protein
MDRAHVGSGPPLSLWGCWWNAPSILTLSTFMWFAAIVAGIFLVSQHLPALGMFRPVSELRAIAVETLANVPAIDCARRDAILHRDGRGVLPGSGALLSCVMWPSTPVGRQHLA